MPSESKVVDIPISKISVRIEDGNAKLVLFPENGNHELTLQSSSGMLGFPETVSVVRITQTAEEKAKTEFLAQDHTPPPNPGMDKVHIPAENDPRDGA